MHELHPHLLAGVTGFISGLLVSIPVGPINVSIINEGARRGFLWGVLIGLGAATMETFYCALAFTGFASFFETGLVKAAMELVSFVFLLYLAVKFLSARSLLGSPAIERRLEEKLHPRSAFMTGVIRVAGNPAVLLFWIILAANFISRELVPADFQGKLACVAGVALGAVSWFLALSYAVSLGKRKLSEKTLVLMERWSGAGLLVLALAHGGNLVLRLARHHLE